MKHSPESRCPGKENLQTGTYSWWRTGAGGWNGVSRTPRDLPSQGQLQRIADSEPQTLRLDSMH
ncbi:hypothetical protein RSAG8_11079, partial [Rhizoctonia solani AG-8 WAC10335]